MDWLDQADLHNLPAFVDVHGYARMVIGEKEIVNRAENALNDLLDQLDEEYRTGPPECDPSERTEVTEAAARKFLQAVVDEYEVWNCERIVTARVDLPKRLNHLHSRKDKADNACRTGIYVYRAAAGSLEVDPN